MLKHEYIYFKLEFSYLKYQNAHYNMEVARVGLLKTHRLFYSAQKGLKPTGCSS